MPRPCTRPHVARGAQSLVRVCDAPGHGSRASRAAKIRSIAHFDTARGARGGPTVQTGQLWGFPCRVTVASGNRPGPAAPGLGGMAGVGICRHPAVVANTSWAVRQPPPRSRRVLPICFLRRPRKMARNRALCILLIYIRKVVPRGGIEPPTRGFSVCVAPFPHVSRNPNTASVSMN